MAQVFNVSLKLILSDPLLAWRGAPNDNVKHEHGRVDGNSATVCVLGHREKITGMCPYRAELGLAVPLRSYS
jgi:hypothetical protein